LSESDFKLGHLVTEAFHPATSDLSALAARSPTAALESLLRVDGDVIERARGLPRDDAALQLGGLARGVVSRRGRIVFVGCGATGRLALLLESLWRRAAAEADRTELSDRVRGVAAGGDYALARSVEHFEDYPALGRLQLQPLELGRQDLVVAVTEGGETPFVIGAAHHALASGAKVAFVYNNPDEVLRGVARSAAVLDEPRILKLCLATGPMAISGSTRMQATTIELIALSGVLEIALRDAGRDEAAAILASISSGLQQSWAKLVEPASLEALAELVLLEQAAYRQGRLAEYGAARYAIDVLSDVTERSPTFSTPPLRKRGDEDASEPWASLLTPYQPGLQAWESVIGRAPACLDWTPAQLGAELGPDIASRLERTLPAITGAELVRLPIADRVNSERRIGGGGMLTLVLGGDDLVRHASFFTDALSRARAIGASRGLLAIGDPAAIDRLAQTYASIGLDGRVAIRCAERDLLIPVLPHATLKIALNALSTCLMAREGRVIGNCMAYVTPTNGKLEDRATRYIARFTALSYEEARQRLRQAMRYVEPRRTSGQAFPPVLPLAVAAHRRGIPLELAERQLQESQLDVSDLATGF
jgi:N-acetylmuramic acid 6-phosphate etherase